MKTNVALLTNLFEEHRNVAEAWPMKKYMKDQFPFLGIKATLRKEIEKTFSIKI